MAEWLDALKARQLEHTALTVLDLIEPIAPFVGQMLWTIQPMARVMNWHVSLSELAKALETPEGIAELRQQLHPRGNP